MEFIRVAASPLVEGKQRRRGCLLAADMQRGKAEPCGQRRKGVEMVMAARGRSFCEMTDFKEEMEMAAAGFLLFFF